MKETEKVEKKETNKTENKTENKTTQTTQTNKTETQNQNKKEETKPKETQNQFMKSKPISKSTMDNMTAEEFRQMTLEAMKANREKNKKKIEVEEIDDDDNFQRKVEENESAAEFVARSGQLQNGTNDPTIDKELALGYLHVNNDKFDQAIIYFTQFLKKYPTVVGGYLGRGTAYAMSGKYDKAFEDFTLAIKTKPDCAVALKSG